MKIKNPTKEAIEVLIKGTTYRIEAEGTLNNIPDDVAEYWQSLHKFLELRKEKVEEVKVEVPAPEVEAIVEETVAEEAEVVLEEKVEEVVVEEKVSTKK